MNGGTDWLPALVLFEDSGGDWARYVEVIYELFRIDFVQSRPLFPGKGVGLKRIPMSDGKEATFWHFISEGKDEGDRVPNFRRCERIRWPRPIIASYQDRAIRPDDHVVWWRNQRGTEWRYVLALRDFSYVVVLADRGNYVLPWTAYFVEHDHYRNKLRREYDSFWARP